MIDVRWCFRFSLVLTILLLACGESGQPPKAAPSASTTIAAVTSTATAVPPTATSESTATAVPPSPTAVPPTPTPALPRYTVVQKQDISFGATKRYSLRVVVQPGLPGGEVERVVEKVIKDICTVEKVNAIGVFVYDDEADSRGVYTVANVEWAPNGIWGDAPTVKAGDYSKHQLYFLGAKRGDPWWGGKRREMGC